MTPPSSLSSTRRTTWPCRLDHTTSTAPVDASMRRTSNLPLRTVSDINNPSMCRGPPGPSKPTGRRKPTPGATAAAWTGPLDWSHAAPDTLGPSTTAPKPYLRDLLEGKHRTAGR